MPLVLPMNLGSQEIPASTGRRVSLLQPREQIPARPTLAMAAPVAGHANAESLEKERTNRASSKSAVRYRNRPSRRAARSRKRPE